FTGADCSVSATHRGANGESVTQPDDRVTVSQGEPVLLKCIYDYDTSYTSLTLWWYEQYPNEAPRLLLTQHEAWDEEERRSRRGFSATPDKQGKSFHLKKNSSELRDSAVYYCAMSDTSGKVKILKLQVWSRPDSRLAQYFLSDCSYYQLLHRKVKGALEWVVMK
uniref:Ig-like domain-containing protein n=1 Tax=Gopherus agassizii TaxID=38772 RepID=A0A452I868_9SAUR